MYSSSEEEGKGVRLYFSLNPGQSAPSVFPLWNSTLWETSVTKDDIVSTEVESLSIHGCVVISFPVGGNITFATLTFNKTEIGLQLF